MMRKIVKDCWTERNGEDFDPVRILGSIGFLAFLAMAAFELVRHCRDFQLLEVSGGIAMILGIFAGGVTIKSNSENK
jgi:hypothetical protein